MTATTDSKILTHQGATAMLAAGTPTAETIGQPQCIIVVDASGQSTAEVRMTGTKSLSRKSAKSKAMTAASTGAPTVNIPDVVHPAIGAVTGGCVTGLPGGLPIIIDGVLLGGIGVGSGTDPQDIEVAHAALAAIGAKV